MRRVGRDPAQLLEVALCSVEAGRCVVGLARAAQSFGPLSAKDYPNSTPFDGIIRRLNVTLMPPSEVVAKPLPVKQ